MNFILIIGIIFYIVGIITYIITFIEENVEFHDGGFLGMGYTTSDHRRMTPKDMRKGLIWPILFIIFFIKLLILLLNDIIYAIILIFGIDYSNTRIYKFIDNKFDI